MRTWLEPLDHAVEEGSDSDLRSLADEGRTFWLDIEDPSDEAIERVADAIGLLPLAVEDSKEFGQKGKAVLYEEIAMIVMFGVENQEPLEVHFQYAPGFLITFRRASSPSLDALHASGEDRRLLAEGGSVRTKEGERSVDPHLVTPTSLHSRRADRGSE